MEPAKSCPRCFRKYPRHETTCPYDGAPLVARVDRDLVGEVLDGRYRVLERIGEGGMGVVYRAEQELIGRVVALKVLTREVLGDEVLVKRFLREARAIASLKSPHTITLYDFGVSRDGLIYYTMDLLEGRSLLDVIHAEAPLDYRRAADIALQTCLSLEDAHNSGILHRDLKPENLFLTPDGGGEHVTVLDFGVAKLLGAPEIEAAASSSPRGNSDTGPALTQVGTVCGTPEYMSPEQAAGGDLSPASDLYALTVVLYEMLCGVVPFKRDSPVKTMLAHLDSPLVPAGERNESARVPASIERFLAHGLEKDSAVRLADVPAYRTALLRAVHEADSPARVTRSGIHPESSASAKAPKARGGAGGTGGRPPGQLPGGLGSSRPHLPTVRLSTDALAAPRMAAPPVAQPVTVVTPTREVEETIEAREGSTPRVTRRRRRPRRRMLLPAAVVLAGVAVTTLAFWRASVGDEWRDVSAALSRAAVAPASPAAAAPPVVRARWRSAENAVRSPARLPHLGPTLPASSNEAFRDGAARRPPDPAAAALRLGVETDVGTARRGDDGVRRADRHPPRRIPAGKKARGPLDPDFLGIGKIPE